VKDIFNFLVASRCARYLRLNFSDGDRNLNDMIVREFDGGGVVAKLADCSNFAWD
jgi:hypothetical protein